MLVGHDVDQSGRPFGLVDVLELLEENLDLLPIGSALRDQV